MCSHCLVFACAFSWAGVKEVTQDLNLDKCHAKDEPWSHRVWFRAEHISATELILGCPSLPALQREVRRARISMCLALTGFSRKIMQLKAPPLAMF